MAKDNNYYVIGGQYEYFCYGGAPTLIGAKRIANKNCEYWDNWQGFHTPKIYAAADTEEIVTNGSLIYPNGEIVRVPKRGAQAIG